MMSHRTNPAFCIRDASGVSDPRLLALQRQRGWDIRYPLTKERIKYLTYGDLDRINASSINAGRNRNFDFARLPIKDDNTLYPVVLAMVHEDQEIRASITLNADGASGWLDMSFEEYESLSLSVI